MADKIAFIGSGNMATNLAYNFDLAGYEVYQIISKNEENAKVLAKKYGAFHGNNVAQLFPDATMVLLCVGDDAIHEVAAQIPSSFRGLVCHCSGSKPLDELAKCKNEKGVFYPMQSFTKKKMISTFSVPIFIEGESIKVENKLEVIAEKISNKVKRISSEERIKYHLSAVFANNFSNLMFIFAKRYLDDNKLDFEFLRPLILETAERMKSGNPENWQTGPAKRGDVETINKHLSMLEDSDLESIYSTLNDFIMTKL